MLRIAFVVYKFQAGGLERCVARLASCLDRSQFCPVIICLDRNGSAAAWLETDDVPVYELNKRPGNDPGLVIRLARLLRTKQVDIIHSHNWGSLLESVLARMVGSVPLHVHAERGLELAEMQTSVWRRRARSLVSRAALGRTDAVVAVSREIRNRLVSIGVPVHRIHLIPNGIDPLPVRDQACERARIRKELGLSESAVLACCVGRLVPVKNFPVAVQSIALVVQSSMDVHLVLVGDGPERDTLQTCARSAGVADRVHLAGERADVGAWLAAADIYVNSSLYEGMSQAVLEAMAAGLPLVVTDVGENVTLVGDVSPCGRVVPSGDAPALALALGELAANKELRACFGQRARQRQRDEFSQEHMIRRYEELYSQLLDAKVSIPGRFALWRR